MVESAAIVGEVDPKTAGSAHEVVRETRRATSAADSRGAFVANSFERHDGALVRALPVATFDIAQATLVPALETPRST
jgi:hypothetical protein